MKILIFFVVVFISMSVNLSDSIIGRMGFDNNYVLVALTALVFSGMVARRRWLVIVVAALLVVAANLPVAMVSGYGLDRDYIAAGLMVVLLLPYALEWLE